MRRKSLHKLSQIKYLESIRPSSFKSVNKFAKYNLKEKAINNMYVLVWQISIKNHYTKFIIQTFIPSQG